MTRERVSANGMQVYLVEQHTLPVMTAQVTVLRGSEANPADKAGLASFTAMMMNEGTEKRTSPQLADDIAQIGATLNAVSSADATSVTGASLTKNADKLFDLLSDVAIHPAFREEEIERVRKRRLTTLIQQNDQPQAVAQRVFLREVYGAKSPYGYLETGTPQSTTGTTRDDIMKFYKGGFAPQDSALVVAGDVTEAQLKSLAQKYFGGWTGQATVSKAPVVENTMTRRIVIVDKPNAPQSALRIGHVGLQRNSPDYAPVLVMNDILGGLFSSRINLNLREQHGYTYGASSRFELRTLAGPFIAGAAVQTAVTDSSLIEFMKELRGILTPVPPRDLDRARNYLALSFPSDFQTDAQIASQMEDLFIYDLPDDTFNHYIDRILAVSADDVSRVARKYIDPDKMIVVVVGDKAQVEQKMNALNLGPLTVMSVDDVLGKAPAGSE